MIIALIILVSLLAISVVVLTILNHMVNDHNVAVGTSPFDADSPHTVLAVFAHPDDEVMVAGTLARLKKHGQVHALYCTHGEDGPTGDLVSKENLGAFREKELQNVGAIIGYDSLEIMDYPDRYLNTVSPKLLKGEIQKRIETLSPDTVICFDDKMGLYGHTDHAFSGLCTQELLVESSHDVQHLLIMTLPNKMIELAKKISQTFKERFDDNTGLPTANYAVKISRYGQQKMAVVKAHKSQWQVMNDVQPLYNKIPAFLYYRIFSREYYNYKRL